MEYGFIEVENEDELSFEDIVWAHDQLKLAFKDKEGHNTNDWAKIRNRYLLKNEIEPEDVEGASKAQRYWINETKKGFKSIKGE